MSELADDEDVDAYSAELYDEDEIDQDDEEGILDEDEARMR